MRNKKYNYNHVECWNNCEDQLKESIKRSKFVFEIRNNLIKKKSEKLGNIKNL